MNKTLKIEIAVLVALLLVAVFVRLDILRVDAQPDSTLQQGQPTEPPTDLPTDPPTDPPTEPPTDPPTEPPTEPPTDPPTEPSADPDHLTLTFGDVTMEAATYFVYNSTEQYWMALSSDADKQVFPASITKLFTAYVAMKYLDPSAVVTVGQEVYMVGEGSSLACLNPGERLTVKQLLACMLLPSGNDAAHTMAVATARAYYADSSMPARQALNAFVGIMNAEAEALGMTGTHFVTPDGYHDYDHYTTCQDLVTIAQLAMGNYLIRETASQRRMTFTMVSGQEKVLINTNQLLDPNSPYYCEDAFGLKTGTTTAAGPCLLSAFEIEGDTIIIGTMACGWSEGRYVETLKLYDLVKEAYAARAE